MEQVQILDYDKRTSKKGNEFFDGKCVVDGKRVYFFCFDKTLVEHGVPPVTISCNVEPTERPEKVKLSDVKLPGKSEKRDGYVQEARRQDDIAGVEKKVAELDGRLKNLQMNFADHLLDQPVRRGAAQGKK